MRCPQLLALLIGTMLSIAAHGAIKSAPTIVQCSWDRPGHNPFVGDVVAAVDRYTDIPQPVRARLKERMRTRSYDDLVDIRRDSIVGKHAYGTEIRDMHFGRGRVCAQVSRKRWTERTHERGLVYCEGAHCILVPTVCRNVSRIHRRETDVAGGPLFIGPVEPREELMGSGSPGAGPAPITSSIAEAVAGEVVPFDAIGVPDEGGGAGPGGGGLGGGPFGFGGPDDFGPVIVPVGAVVLTTNPVVAVPEPATWAGMAAGLLMLIGLRAWPQRRTTGAPRCATQKRS